MSEIQEGSTNVLLSIKPEFAEKILDNEKRYEFRKTKFSEIDAIGKVLMYASAPVQEIVGMFTIGEVIERTPETLWGRFGEESGIANKDRFMSYFDGNETGYAIEVEKAQRLSSPVDPRQHLTEFRPPVSFQYIRGELASLLNPNFLQTA